MKIVHMIGSGGVGGIETHIFTLSMVQRKLGHEVSIIVKHKPGAVSDLMAENGLDVYCIYGKHGHDFKAYLRVRGLLKRLKPDIVHVHGGAILHTIALPGIPATKVRTVHVLSTNNNGWRISRFMSFINHRVVRFLDGFIAVSSDVRNQFMARGLFTNCPWRVILNGIDQTRFYPDENLSLPEKGSDSPVELLMVCRMQPDKHPEDAIRVLSILREQYGLNVRLTLCGDGISLDSCRNLVKELGISDFVTIAGRRNDVNDFMRKSHGTFILSDYEACPQVPIEGISSGCPVFAYHVPGGLHEWFKEEGCGGVISKERTPESLAEAIVPVLSNVELWRKIRMEALNCARDFSCEKMVENTLEYYNTLNSSR